MKVIVKEAANKKIPFDELAIGEVFALSEDTLDDLRIKTDDKGRMGYALNFEYCEIEYFHSKDMVIPLDAELVVKAK